MTTISRRRPPPDPEQMLSVRTVASWLGVSEFTVRGWTYAGAFPRPTKFGNGRSAAVRYRRGDVQAWLDDQRARDE